MGSLYVTSAGLADYIANRKEMMRAGRRSVRRAQERSREGERSRSAIQLAEAAQAHRDLEARKTVGSVILVP